MVHLLIFLKLVFFMETMETKIDKSRELNATVKLMNDKLKFEGRVQNNEPVAIDYVAPLGDDNGYASLELLLLSLSSCIGSAVLTFLRKMRKTISACEITSVGFRKEDHPTAFKIIKLDINLSSPDVTSEDMLKVIKLSEDTYCPVWSMLKGNVEVDVKFRING
jgi:putative redox protein